MFASKPGPGLEAEKQVQGLQAPRVRAGPGQVPRKRLPEAGDHPGVTPRQELGAMAMRRRGVLEGEDPLVGFGPARNDLRKASRLLPRAAASARPSPATTGMAAVAARAATMARGAATAAARAMAAAPAAEATTAAETATTTMAAAAPLPPHHHGQEGGELHPHLRGRLDHDRLIDRRRGQAGDRPVRAEGVTPPRARISRTCSTALASSTLLWCGRCSSSCRATASRLIDAKRSRCTLAAAVTRSSSLASTQRRSGM